jgi:hypothetical protein
MALECLQEGIPVVSKTCDSLDKWESLLPMLLLRLALHRTEHKRGAIGLQGGPFYNRPVAKDEFFGVL